MAFSVQVFILYSVFQLSDWGHSLFKRSCYILCFSVVWLGAFSVQAFIFYSLFFSCLIGCRRNIRLPMMSHGGTSLTCSPSYRNIRLSRLNSKPMKKDWATLMRWVDTKGSIEDVGITGCKIVLLTNLKSISMWSTNCQLNCIHNVTKANN